jgi:hypothetical protein
MADTGLEASPAVGFSDPQVHKILVLRVAAFDSNSAQSLIRSADSSLLLASRDHEVAIVHRGSMAPSLSR